MPEGHAPTDRFLDLLAEKTKPIEIQMNPPSEAFLAHETVQRYAGTLDDLTPAERDKRLGTLESFAEFVGKSPDTMIEEIYNRETRKYRKRGFYTDKAREFGAQLEGPPSLQLARANLIRSFFIANGFRLTPERPSWM
jgi:hypothetical protein